MPPSTPIDYEFEASAPPIPANKARNLTVKQVAEIYRNYFDDVFYALADARWKFVKSNKVITNEEKLGWKARIDSYRP